MRRLLLAVAAVFVAWVALDFVMHGVILRTSYEATSQLWRPMQEMKMGVMYVAVAIAAFAFVMLYARLSPERNLRGGLEYGFWFGVAGGVSMGYGSYAVMPIPYHMALVWALGTLVESLVAGLIAGALLRRRGEWV